MTLITTPQVCQLFGVSHVAVSNWRKGGKTRAALPVAKAPKGANPRNVFFDAGEVFAWAKKHNVAVVADEATVAKIKEGNATPEPTKPGPKPAAKPATKVSVAAKKSTRQESYRGH
jgi:phage terminase Nu1 subunit (DNA packaging protein)